MQSWLTRHVRIKLDHCRWLYWSDWQRNDVGRCRYDGSESEELFTTSPSRFNGIHIDLEGKLWFRIRIWLTYIKHFYIPIIERHLYIADAINDVITRLNLENTSDVTTVFVNQSSEFKLYFPNSITKFENKLYITDWGNQNRWVTSQLTTSFP